MHSVPIQSTGWLLDSFPQRNAMVLWFILETGKRLRLADPFAPSFFIDMDSPPLAAAERAALLRDLERTPGLEAAGMAERVDFWTGQPRRVLEVRVTDLDRHAANVKALYRRRPGLRYYNCDIPPEILYGYSTGLFPTARCAIRHDGEGHLVACEPLDGPLDVDYALPPLRVAELAAEGARLAPRPFIRSLTLSAEGRSWTWDSGENDPAEMLASFRDQLRRLDPDLIWTRGGDALIIPVLLALAARCRIDLGLDREPGVRRRAGASGRTYVSYGQVLYHAPDHPLFGRWHIDRDNSFWSKETGLAGIVEVARMSKIPVQRAARRSIGTGITSIQLDLAWRHGILIPWKKSRPEAWKSAATLLKSDRGGLVYQPVVGVYEDVIELDFVSMYPSIMVRRNVSPETVGCACCPPSPDVPELGYTICKRRRGLVSQAIEPVIAKRREYKAMMKAAAATDPARAAELDGRQGALKWLLVCCFGYLGYRNARFGRIEAHETTCAFSRELLMRAKEAAESRGFTMIHSIVDCLWLKRSGGAADEEVATLCAEIDRATGLSIAVEGRYRWVAFLPSRQNDELPIPNRYFGCFATGKLKFRGIEARRRDQAPFIQRFQIGLLERLAAKARTLADCRAMREELAGMVREAEDRLRSRDVPIAELIVRRKTSKDAEEYRGNSMTAVAVRQAHRAGLELHAGQSVCYVVTRAGDRDADSRLRVPALMQPEESYDVDWYIEQVRRAAATVLEPLLGAPIYEILGLAEKPRRKKASRLTPTAPPSGLASESQACQLDLFDCAR